MIDQQIINVLIANSKFKEDFQELVDFTTKVFNSAKVFENDTISQEKKIDYLKKLINDALPLQQKYKLHDESLSAFFSRFICNLHDNHLEERLEGIIFEQLLMNPSKKAFPCFGNEERCL